MKSAAESDLTSVKNIEDFNRNDGTVLERLIFNNRIVILVLCVLVTALLSTQLPKLELNASFERMIPTSHPYISNYLDNKRDLAGLGNVVRVVVENRQGSILDKDYLATLQALTDELFLLPGVDRQAVFSLWAPTARWSMVTEEGLEGGLIIPDDYRGTEEDLAVIGRNIDRAQMVGSIVGNDYRSSTILLPLLDMDPQTGQELNYGEFTDALKKLRDKYSSDTVNVRITGFAKIVGDLIAAFPQIMAFFLIAIAICTAVVLWYTRCVRSTALVVACSLIGVVWQLGLLPIMGFVVDPYSVLVPFLIFAIGMSHGAQKMNGVMQDIGRGVHRLIAARYTFRRLFMAGLTALVADAAGFAVLLLIDISVIQQLALVASLGVVILIFTNLILLPILLSFFGVSKRAAERSLRTDEANAAGNINICWRFLTSFTRTGPATLAIVLGIALASVGWNVSRDLQIGDLDAGAPELRPNSTYNRDNAYLTSHYATSSDQFVAMVTTPTNGCVTYDALKIVDDLTWHLNQVPGVVTTKSFATHARALTAALNEGNPKWYTILRNDRSLSDIASYGSEGHFNPECSLHIVVASLSDHRAETLRNVVAAVEEFAGRSNTEDVKILLAAGNAGIEAATNIVVEKANHQMLFGVYGIITILCFITFRSWRAAICAILPLMLTSVLAEALMVVLGIGVKVSTLPVIALGVGIGIDYALYVLSVTLTHMRNGADLGTAYLRALLFTGRMVMMTGATLAVAVSTWAFSPIKFQADMGVLLAFMFLWNMIGALVLVPALARFILVPEFRNVERGAVPAAI